MDPSSNKLTGQDIYVPCAVRETGLGPDPFRGAIKRAGGVVIWTCRHIQGHTRNQAERCAKAELESWGFEEPSTQQAAGVHFCPDCAKDFVGRVYAVGGGGMRRRLICIDCFMAPRTPPMPPLGYGGWRSASPWL